MRTGEWWERILLTADFTPWINARCSSYVVPWKIFPSPCKSSENVSALNWKLTENYIWSVAPTLFLTFSFYVLERLRQFRGYHDCLITKWDCIFSKAIQLSSIGILIKWGSVAVFYAAPWLQTKWHISKIMKMYLIIYYKKRCSQDHSPKLPNMTSWSFNHHHIFFI